MVSIPSATAASSSTTTTTRKKNTNTRNNRNWLDRRSSIRHNTTTTVEDTNENDDSNDDLDNAKGNKKKGGLLFGRKDIKDNTNEEDNIGMEKKNGWNFEWKRMVNGNIDTNQESGNDTKDGKEVVKKTKDNKSKKRKKKEKEKEKEKEEEEATPSDNEKSDGENTVIKRNCHWRNGWRRTVVHDAPLGIPKDGVVEDDRNEMKNKEEEKDETKKDVTKDNDDKEESNVTNNHKTKRWGRKGSPQKWDVRNEDANDLVKPNDNNSNDDNDDEVEKEQKKKRVLEQTKDTGTKQTTNGNQGEEEEQYSIESQAVNADTTTTNKEPDNTKDDDEDRERIKDLSDEESRTATNQNGDDDDDEKDEEPNEKDETTTSNHRSQTKENKSTTSRKEDKSKSSSLPPTGPSFLFLPSTSTSPFFNNNPFHQHPNSSPFHPNLPPRYPPNVPQQPLLPPTTPLPNTFLRILEPLVPLLSRLLTLALLSFLSGKGHSDRNGRWSLFGKRKWRNPPIRHSSPPKQHFVLERMDERYVRDDAAMKWALEKPPPIVLWGRSMGEGGGGGDGGMGRRGWNKLVKRRRKDLKRMMVGKEEETETEMSNVVVVDKEEEDLDNGGDHTFPSLPAATTTTTIPLLKPRRKTKTDTSKSNSNLYDRTVILVDINTESQPVEDVVTHLRDVVTFLLHQYHDTSRLDFGRELEVVFTVESPGGSVAEFGLAADQIARLRRAGTILRDEKEGGAGVVEEDGEGDESHHPQRPDLIVTVCVDRIAASGGYMIACQASTSHLYAAPFATLGSIGVLNSSTNYHSLLKKYGLRPLLITAGNQKAPLTSTSEVTKEGLEVVKRKLGRIHEAFRGMVEERRSGSEGWPHGGGVEIMEGDTYLGQEAVALGLADRAITSDEYVLERVRSGDRVLKLVKCEGRMMRSPSLLELLFLSTKLEDASSGSPTRRLGKVLEKVVATTCRLGGIVGLAKIFLMETGRAGKLRWGWSSFSDDASCRSGGDDVRYNGY